MRNQQLLHRYQAEIQYTMVTYIVSGTGSATVVLNHEQGKPGWWPEASGVMCTCLRQRVTKSIPSRRDLKGKEGWRAFGS